MIIINLFKDNNFPKFMSGFSRFEVLNQDKSSQSLSDLDCEEIEHPENVHKYHQFYKSCSDLFDSHQNSFNKFFTLPMHMDAKIELPEYKTQTLYTFLEVEEKRNLIQRIKYLKEIAYHNAILRDAFSLIDTK